MAAPDAIRELTRNAVDVLPHGELERKLADGRPLRVKLGIDVTAPHVHVGHAIPLQRMAAFQRADIDRWIKVVKTANLKPE